MVSLKGIMPLSKARMRVLSQQRRDAMRQTYDKPILEKFDKPKQEKLKALRELINKVESQKPSDVVLPLHPQQREDLKVVLDASGNEIPEYW